MSKELVISSNRHETKVAILEDDVLVEIFFQRANEYSLAGSIHKGRVTRVLPGMQSAFVDLGLERDTFLYVSDFADDHSDDLDKIGDEKPVSAPRHREPAPYRAPAPAIEAAPAETEIAATESTAAAEGESSPASGEVRPFRDRNDRDRGRGGRDRGGRGRDRGRDRDRGGRPGRRGPAGLPDSKYASAEAASAEAAPVVEENTPSDAPFIAPRVADLLSPEPAEPVFLLPGESLAKYRRPASAPPPPPPPPLEVVTDEVSEAVAEEAVEVPVPPAAAEQEPEQEQEPEPESFIVPEPEPVPEPPPVVEYVDTSFAKLPDDIDPTELEDVDAIDEAREVLLTETAGDDDEADAAQAAAEELLAEGVEPSEPEAETDDDAEGDEPAEEGGEGGPEPARQPHSLTAALRERDRGARFQRGRRGRRRRGRGNDREDRPAAAAGAAPALEAGPEAELEAAPVEGAPETKVAEARPERAERPERGGDRGGRPFRERTERPPLPSITDLLKAGQEILVQIAKEPIAQKGARITSHIALPGRYCVYMPTVDHNGVSRKIASDEERLRLKRILQQHRQGMSGGFIIRTAGEGQSEEDIANDMQFLYNLWLDIKGKSEKRNAPCLVHHDLDIVQRTLRDQVSSDFKTIWLDNEEIYASTLTFVQRFQPAMINRVKLWTRPVPIFDAFGITNELEKALRPKVWLKSGGYIVINQTEALVAIDINTGKFVGKSNRLEDTIVKTNTEAVKEIVRQIRLRDLGGIIVVDFIDMDERKNRQKVMAALEDAMRVDRAPYKILQFNDFGLVAITRKRVKQSLERTLCQPCPYCEGAGSVKSVPTVIGEILLEAQKIAKAVDDKTVVLRVHPEVAKVLKSHRNQYLEELETIFGRPVLVTGDAAVHIEKFDLA
ncbi:MAG: Rne/Rng family ribonuclease [Bryobacterales bacterium]|nr:Rne/Rng family ribonuclease [Bryobacterales bacterium]